MSGGGDNAAEQSVKTGESPNQADEEGNKQAGAIETAKVSQDTVAGERTETFQCAVCYEDHNLGELARMPCCFVEGSSTNFCKSCVQVGDGGISHHASPDKAMTLAARRR
jgi:hypothetical protein